MPQELISVLAGQQDQRRQGVVGAHPQDHQPDHGAPAPGCSHHRANQYGARRLLPETRGAIGKAKAVTATAQKIAIHFYNAMRFGTAYVDRGASHYEQHYRDRVIKNLHRRAAEFGFVLQRVETVSLRKNKKNPIPRYRV